MEAAGAGEAVAGQMEATGAGETVPRQVCPCRRCLLDGQILGSGTPPANLMVLRKEGETP